MSRRMNPLALLIRAAEHVMETHVDPVVCEWANTTHEEDER